MDFLIMADQFLIQLYRITGMTILDYFLGTFLLALSAVVLGEWTLSLVLRFNRHYVDKIEDEMLRQHRLSLRALRQNDEKAYKACNHEANDAFGRYFFTMVAYSAAILWPVPFVLAWMQTRFSEVEFQLVYPVSLIWSSTGYFTVFILLYILARIVFKNIRSYLPYFREVQKTLDLFDEHSGENHPSESAADSR